MLRVTGIAKDMLETTALGSYNPTSTERHKYNLQELT